MLQVQPVTLADLPAVTDLWFNGFRHTSIVNLMPDTPGVRQWWNDANAHDILTKPTVRYWKVVDDETGALVAYSKWDMESAEERGDRFPPWHPDMDQETCSVFFAQLEEQRKGFLGGTKNYCISPFLLLSFSRSPPFKDPFVPN